MLLGSAAEGESPYISRNEIVVESGSCNATRVGVHQALIIKLRTVQGVTKRRYTCQGLLDSFAKWLRNLIAQPPEDELLEQTHTIVRNTQQ